MGQKKFTEEQIQAIAYSLWEARNQSSGAPENDWQKAIELLKAASLLSYKQRQALEFLGNKDEREFVLKFKLFQLEQIKTVISAVGLLATGLAAIGLLITYWQGQERLEQDQERLVTERYAKAVEQLGHGKIPVNVGAIYALERIAKDSHEDYWAVIETLTAYVRDRSPFSKESKPMQDSISGLFFTPAKISTDVQSALTTIGGYVNRFVSKIQIR